MNVRTTKRETQYATRDSLLESLEAMRTKYNLPLRQALSFITTGKTDKVSLGKENPYLRFHANLIRNVVYISIQDPTRELSFQIALDALVAVL